MHYVLVLTRRFPEVILLLKKTYNITQFCLEANSPFGAKMDYAHSFILVLKVEFQHGI